MAGPDNDGWGSSWPSPPAITPEEESIIREAKRLFKTCVNWEAIARTRFDYDYKFANADSHNKYQWEDKWITKRENEQRPCLTINKTQVHNLLIINDAKQNKPGVRIRPVGEEATFDAAQVYQEVIYHIEYISNAENVYDWAVTFQVQGGIGYWRVSVDYMSEKTFDQEIYIRRIKDPRSVYLDPNINELDGSDARFGFIFDDMPKDLFRLDHPEFAGIADRTVLGESASDGWITQDKIRVCEYYKKEQKKDKLVHWITEVDGEQTLKFRSELDVNEKFLYRSLKEDEEAAKRMQFQERDVLTPDIKWYKIAGDRIVNKGPWLGKYIPIVRVVGTETVIDGELDRKGNTRALINAQQMYNVNTSANVEFGALQTKVPWLAPMAAIQNFEEYWKTANVINHAYLPYNHVDEDGKEIPKPERPQPPMPSQAYVQEIQIAQNEMMMATGQYQSQFGENENAKSGVAINARQRQGDRATYHFVDNQAIAIRFTGKILIDLIPKVYDTKRVMQITTVDGKEMKITVDPKAKDAVTKLDPIPITPTKKIENIIFNPNVGMYDLQADTGPSFATRRMDAFNAMTQIAAQNPDFMEKAGDIYFKVADFPEADILAERWRKLLPPAIQDENAIDPAITQAMEQAGAKIDQLTGVIEQQAKQIADRSEEFRLKEMEINQRLGKFVAEEERGDYDATTKRLTAVGNAGPGLSIEQLQPIIKQTIIGMLQAGNLEMDTEMTLPGPKEGGTPVIGNEEEKVEGVEEPPVPDAKRGVDGKWYVTRNNQHYLVE